MECGAGKERTAEGVVRFAWTGRVKAKTAEDEPCGHGAGVFIARGGLRGVKLPHYLVDPEARSVRATRGREEIEKVVHRLIALGVLAKGAGSHLRHRVNFLSVDSDVEVVRHG